MQEVTVQIWINGVAQPEVPYWEIWHWDPVHGRTQERGNGGDDIFGGGGDATHCWITIKTGKISVIDPNSAAWKAVQGTFIPNNPATGSGTLLSTTKDPKLKETVQTTRTVTADGATNPTDHTTVGTGN
jgi:hypothetical protein